MIMDLIPGLYQSINDQYDRIAELAKKNTDVHFRLFEQEVAEWHSSVLAVLDCDEPDADHLKKIRLDLDYLDQVLDGDIDIKKEPALIRFGTAQMKNIISKRAHS